MKWRYLSLPGWTRELAQTARFLSHRRDFSIALVLGLGIVVGAVTATYSVFNHVLLRPVPGARDQTRLLSTFVGVVGQPQSLTTASYLHLAAMREAGSLEGLTSAASALVTLQVGTSDVKRQRVLFVSSGFFEVLKVQPVLGRLLTPGEYETDG